MLWSYGRSVTCHPDDGSPALTRRLLVRPRRLKTGQLIVRFSIIFLTGQVAKKNRTVRSKTGHLATLPTCVQNMTRQDSSLPRWTPSSVNRFDETDALH